jgi:hypothetical protein
VGGFCAFELGALIRNLGCGCAVRWKGVGARCEVRGARLARSQACAGDVADLGSARGARSCVLRVGGRRLGCRLEGAKRGSWPAPGSEGDGRRATGGCPSDFTARVKYVETGAPGRISTDGSVKWQAARVVSPLLYSGVDKFNDGVRGEGRKIVGDCAVRRNKIS